MPVRLRRFTARRKLWWAGLAIGVIVVRLAMLALVPVPVPIIEDEYSYLLAADTFAHGALANPALAHGEFFESPHILVRPFYASKYHPGQGLVLALGQKLGNPYWGVLLSGGLMIFLFCWAADAWLPPQWSLLAGMLCFLVFLPHYWLNTYWGGAVAACGGAFITGAIGRLVRGRLRPASWALAPGAALLYATRPYEGAVFCFTALILLTCLFARFHDKTRFLRAVALPNITMLLVAAALGAWYNWRITGNPAELPYFVHSRQYEQATVLLILPASRERKIVYSNDHLSRLYNDELDEYHRTRNMSTPRLIAMQLTFFLLGSVYQQFLLFGLLLFALPWTRLRNRKKWLAPLFFAGMVALFAELKPLAHYSAPFTAAELILIVAAGRSVWYRMAASRWRGPMFLGAVLLAFVPLALDYTGFLSKSTREREPVIRQLEAQGGRHLVFVHYNPQWSYEREWVYNGARLQESPIVFAHDKGVEKDRELLDEFGGRKLWRLELGPRDDDVKLEPYTALAEAGPLPQRHQASR